MSHVFLSYIRENAAEVDRLATDLRQFSIDVWLDREQIAPGVRWQDAIRRAIREGASFIACFSRGTELRGRTYMNEELIIAIEEVRLRPITSSWLIPVLLSLCEVPELPLGMGATLQSLQFVRLYEDWDGGVRRIADVIAPVSGKMWDVLRLLEGHKIPSYSGKTKYLIEEVSLGSRIVLSSAGRKEQATLAWKDVERVYTWQRSEHLTPTLVDQILMDSKNLDSSPMCALVLAMWDPSRVASV
jgi:hypothetical protein